MIGGLQEKPDRRQCPRRLSAAWHETLNIRVLLVDDDALYMEAVQSSLEDRGFAVRAFADAAALLEAPDIALHADMLVLDWTLCRAYKASSSCRR